MSTSSRTAHQQVPHDDAVRLRELRDVDSPLLNALLAAYRGRGLLFGLLGCQRLLGGPGGVKVM